MDKKRKYGLPTLTAERGAECENKDDGESQKEQLNASTEKKLKDKLLPNKKDEHSVDSVTIKLGLGAKRTKKPPKSLENFICRPTLRVTQKPGPVAGHRLLPVQKKTYSDSLATNTSSHVTNTNMPSSSALPLSSVIHSKRESPGSDSSNTMAAKKVRPKQLKKKDLKSDIVLDEPLNVIHLQSSLSPNKTSSTSKKQIHTSRPAPASCSPLQQDSSSQERRLDNEDVQQQAQFSLNSGQLNQCESNSSPILCDKNSTFLKQTSCQLENDLKCIESNSEMSLRVNLNLNKESEGCTHNSESPKKRYSKTIIGKKKKQQNGSMQLPGICANDPPIQPQSAQVADSSSPNKSSGSTIDSLDSFSRTSEQTENKDLNGTLETTMKLCQTVQQGQIDVRAEGSAHDEHEKKRMLCQEQTEPSPSSHITITGPILNQQPDPFPAKKLLDVQTKHDKHLSKNQKLKQLYSSKIKKKKKEIECNLVGCTTTLQSVSQNGTPSFQSLTSQSSSRSEQKTSEQDRKSKQTQNSSVISDISTQNKLQHRKRGRPTVKLEVPLKGNASQLQDAKPTNTESPQDPSLEIRDPRPQNKKRGRPKRSISVTEKGTLSTSVSKKQDNGNYQMNSKDKLQICTRSNRVLMKTIIGKINKMEVKKKKDKVLTNILMGQKQCDRTDLSQEGCGGDTCKPASPATHSLSSLVTSFGGKLGPQINVSKRGTIYMGKRRGRKPKYQRNSSSASKQTSLGASVQQSLDNKGGSFSSSSCTFKNASSPPRLQEKTTLFSHLSDLHHSKGHFEATLTCNTGVRSDSSVSDRGNWETNSRLSANVGFGPGLASGEVFTMSGSSGSHSTKSRPKGLSCLALEHLSSAHMQLGSGRSQDSSETQPASPLLSLTSEEAHKLKCHRKGHHCLSHDRIRRHKYKCKKKYMQLKRQDPNFLAEVENLIVRLREVHIVHCITRTRLEGEGSPTGRKSLKGKIQSHDLQCLQEKVHSPTMFQINFSGYYSPHSGLACDHPHYVRTANMRRKHGCSSESSEPIVTHFPVKLGYPLSGSGYYHSSYKVPFATTSLGFGLYQGYPPTSTLYPTHFPPAYMHHYSKNPIISPSKFQKKKFKFPTQYSGVYWGGKTQGTYPRMNTHPPCDCFSNQSWQKEKQKERWKNGRDEHGTAREREHGIDWITKDNENSGDFSSTPPCSSSVFSKTQNKDKTFMQAHMTTSNLRETEEVRWSEHQPPWTRGLDSKLGNRSQSQKIRSKELGHTLEGRQRDWDLNSHQQTSRRSFSFLKQPTLFTSSQTLRRNKTVNGHSSASGVPIDQTGTSVPQYTDKSVEGKRQGSCSPSARTLKKAQKEPTGCKSHRNLHIQDESDHLCQTSLQFMPKHVQSNAKLSISTTSLREEMQAHLKSSRPQKLQRPGITSAEEVKKRGRGRPRKNPLTPSQLLTSSTELNTQQIEEKAEKCERGQRRVDTILDTIEAVIQGGQRRGRKRKKVEKEPREGLQKLNEDKDRIKTSTNLHTSSTPIDASSDQVAPTDADFQNYFSMPAEKKYLWAGLYSDVYKNEDIPHQPQQLNIECVQYNPEEHEHGLFPPPLHVGIYLRLKRIDFKLPYDIYWLYAHNKDDSSLQEISHKPSRNPSSKKVPQSCTDDDQHTKFIEEMEQTYANEDSPSQLHCENQHQLLKQQEENCDTEDFFLTLSGEERCFVKKHSIFLVRNYEKMRARQALLLRQGVREQEIEKEVDRERCQKEDGDIGEGPATQSDRCLTEWRSCPEEEHMIPQSRILTQTLQEILDSIISCKGSSGQTLSAPLLNLCSRKRSDSALLDFSTVQRLLLSGQYESLEDFNTDMLKVFQSAEKYYGSESSVGHDVSQLRASYNRVYQEASTKISNFQKRI